MRNCFVTGRNAQMVLAWLDTRTAVEFAHTMAREIQQSMPPSDEVPGKKEAGKRAKKIERIATQAKAFSRDNRLNVYKKAKLANTLKWSLKEAGYSDVFVREMVGLVLVNL
jgi:hypothetical protein